MSENNMKHRSSVYDSMVKSPNRAMLRATGMTDDSFEKPIVGVISTWAENTPCNIHLHGLVKLPKKVLKTRVLGQFNLVRLPLLMVLLWGHQGCVSH